MAYGFRSIFRANLYVVWFVCDCVMVKDRFHRVLGLSKIERCVLGQQNPKQNGKWGCAQIPAHSCESVVSTLDGHNFLVHGATTAQFSRAQLLNKRPYSRGASSTQAD